MAEVEMMAYINLITRANKPQKADARENTTTRHVSARRKNV